MRDLRRLPKAHLHLHLDGSLRRETLRELADAAGIDAPLPTGYGSFADFTDTISAAAAVLRGESEVARVLEETAADAAADGAVWVEVSMWPGLFRGRLGSFAEATDVVLAAARAATSATGVGVGILLAANRDLGPEEACAVARLAAGRAGDGVVGFGLDGNEASAPPALFVEACEIARAHGLPVVPHAGELLGPESVAAAVDLLGARRVMHGVRAIEDPALAERLAADRIRLHVCPTSNVMLSVAPSLEEHPLPALLAAGVACSVDADDPLLFDTTLLREYERCRDSLGLDDEALGGIARTSLEASAAPPDVAAAALRGIDEWLAAPATPR